MEVDPAIGRAFAAPTTAWPQLRHPAMRQISVGIGSADPSSLKIYPIQERDLQHVS
jgi:hypothetical protein